MCCCCALVQELREVEIRGAYGMNYIDRYILTQRLVLALKHEQISFLNILAGTEKTKISPPSSQFMEH